MAWNEKDFERYTSETASFEADLDLLDSLEAGFVEGWNSGPTASISRFWRASQGQKNKKGADINVEYGLEGTPAAFAPDEDVSDEHAKIVLERHLNRENNEAIAQRVSDDFGFVGDITNFAGNLTSGFVDPINLAAGVGTSLAVNKMGIVAARKVFADVAAKTTFGDVVGSQLLENLASSVLVDAAIVPLGDEVLNQPVSAERRMMNVIGATLMGTAIGTPLEFKAVADARFIAYKTSQQHGSSALDIHNRANQKAMMDVANGIKPNADHVVRMSEMEWHTARPDQTPYAHVELDASNVDQPTYFIGRDFENQHFDFVEEHGSGTITMVDNPNLVHNRVQPIKGKNVGVGDGEVFPVNLKTKNVLTDDMFDGVKSDIREAVKNVFDSSNANKKARSSFLQKIAQATEDSNGILDYKDALHEIIEDFHGVESIDDIVNKALHGMGYDGYHSVGSAVTMDAPYNAITLFDPKVFKKDFKGKNLMYVGKGKSSKNAAKSSKEGDRLFFNSDYVEAFEGGSTQAFDPKHPQAENFMKTFQDTETAEIKRRDDPTQQIGYDESAMKDLEANKVISEEYDSAAELLESEKYEINALKEKKNLDKQTADSIAIAENPNIAREAADFLINCKRG